MTSLDFIIFYEKDVQIDLKTKILALEKFCFSHVNLIDINECFYSEIFARVCTFFEKELVGHLILHKREIMFDEKRIIIGGAVGACVKDNMRRKGIAEKMMQIGLEKLKKESCDIACLTVDPEDGQDAIKLYKKLGYAIMNREISYEDIYGKLRYDSDTMFISLCSDSLFKHIMENSHTFHYGKGYW